jgi:hypothetical protein
VGGRIWWAALSPFAGLSTGPDGSSNEAAWSTDEEGN